jgi:4-aminobutyrate aminotransferase
MHRRKRMPPTDRKTATRGVPQSEGDTNLTGARAAWQARALDAETRALLAEDERYFLRQSVSTPCLNTIAKADGIFIEDSGRPPLHGLPRQQCASHRLRSSAPEAGDRRADGCAALCAAPLRLRTGHRARAQAQRDSPFGPAKVLFTTGGSDASRLPSRLPRGNRPTQDPVVLGCLPWGGRWRVGIVG